MVHVASIVKLVGLEMPNVSYTVVYPEKPYNCVYDKWEVSVLLEKQVNCS